MRAQPNLAGITRWSKCSSPQSHAERRFGCISASTAICPYLIATFVACSSAALCSAIICSKNSSTGSRSLARAFMDRDAAETPLSPRASPSRSTFLWIFAAQAPITGQADPLADPLWRSQIPSPFWNLDWVQSESGLNGIRILLESLHKTQSFWCLATTSSHRKHRQPCRKNGHSRLKSHDSTPKIAILARNQ